MKLLRILIFLSICFPQELKVGDNLNVTGAMINDNDIEKTFIELGCQSGILEGELKFNCPCDDNNWSLYINVETYINDCPKKSRNKLKKIIYKSNHEISNQYLYKLDNHLDSLHYNEIDLNFNENNSWRRSTSYGLWSEKYPFGIFHKSYIDSLNQNIDFNITIGSSILINGLGLGYKYYLKKNSKFSIYLNACLHSTIVSTSEGTGIVSGITLAQGYSYNNFNFGVLFTYLPVNGFFPPISPFINLEKRF